MICWDLQGPDRTVQAVQARLGELEPGFGGRVSLRFGGSSDIALRITRAPAGRSVTACGEGGPAEPLLAAVGRQLRPWVVRPAVRRAGSTALEVALAEGDVNEPCLITHLAEGLVIGLANALGERFSFPCSDRCHEERDLTAPVHLAPGRLERALAPTGLAGLAETFCRAGEEAGVNGLALAALAAWQSAWGTARIAREQRNLLGWGVGLGAEGAPDFATAAESIAAVAPMIRRDYLTPGGRRFHGSNLIGMNLDYAVDPLWRHGVAAIWRKLAGD